MEKQQGHEACKQMRPEAFLRKNSKGIKEGKKNGAFGAKGNSKGIAPLALRATDLRLWRKGKGILAKEKGG